MTHGLEWEPPLQYRRGGYTYLDHIDVFYDFNWEAVCGHDRGQFRNGRCLALLARQNCPEGKTPTLLLTARDDVQEGFRQTEARFFVVVNLPNYLKLATGNAAISYYAMQLQYAIAWQDVATRPEVVANFLTVGGIAEWTRQSPERLDELRMIIEQAPPAGTTGSPEAVVTALSCLTDAPVDSEVVSAVARLFGPHTDRERRLELLRQLTDDSEGRHLTGEVIAERMADRIADARSAMAAYQALLEDPATGEAAMQDFIERNLWLLGLDYTRMIPQRRILVGALDFELERVDGFHDILELKDPKDELVTTRKQEVDGTPAPPPSSYSYSSGLAQALAQVHAYRDQMDRHAEAQEDLVGLPTSRDPRFIILIGRGDHLPAHARRVLGELNKSLHRVEVIPYDVLARRATAMLSNVEKYLLGRGQANDDFLT
jgi:Domain of unknown function (DUF4263)